MARVRLVLLFGWVETAHTPSLEELASGEQYPVGIRGQ